MAASKVRLKLLIDTKGKRVLFAESGKDFVDFLFYLFSLPVGNVVKLLKEKSLVGCLDKLYESVENLGETYMQPNQDKNLVLNPKPFLCAAGIPLLLSDNEPNTRKFYTCPDGHSYVAEGAKLLCPKCKQRLNHALSYVLQASANTGTGAMVEGGFVKGVVTYMVMDNLEVMPLSTISGIALLNKLNVKDVGVLEEKIVDFGVEEGLNLLKASMECKNVLTSVFFETEGANNGA